MTAQEYIAELEAALTANQDARLFYFPPGREARREANLRQAREEGYGLRGLPDAKKIVGTLYGRLVVRFSLDRFGVALDAKEFLAELRKAKTGA